MRCHADDAIAADQAQVVDFPLAVAEATHHQTTATRGDFGARLDRRYDRIALGSLELEAAQSSLSIVYFPQVSPKPASEVHESQINQT
ncbi:unnamed protein product [Tuwongella immobilis]|uniref:Uncharacterized protein n=1 Tax=Tuwongella immobilis TaxID=692036 RepID=A0A6C2YQJ0_9BACT|nr:unnamed protein product [Tuwongella immobilis]VTS04860.1 unnamed protein product [Tuwongella immobilis]